ncbi:hypothetical protein [Clostridium neonatale]|uniref:Uncharacterized protein n=1 Tax=Clostridium neonatale TaxID=137838 RepID=A0AA86JDE4_9CLOT|nr:hypothetical protein CNEO_30008 [Clostridium neonatale]
MNIRGIEWQSAKQLIEQQQKQIEELKQVIKAKDILIQKLNDEISE